MEPEKKIEFKPGQFVMIKVNDGQRDWYRSFSIANHPEDSGENIIRLVIKLLPQGLASEYMKNKKVGDQIEITDARGLMTFKSQEKENVYMCATGTGLIPLLSMLEHALPNSLKAKTYNLLWGNRYKVDIFWLERLTALKNNFTNFNFQITLSKPVGYWDGAKGYVTDIIKNTDVNNNTDHFYLCGLPQMIDDAILILNEKGISKENIFQEKYVSHGKTRTS